MGSWFPTLATKTKTSQGWGTQHEETVEGVCQSPRVYLFRSSFYPFVDAREQPRVLPDVAPLGIMFPDEPYASYLSDSR
jgi:hypothetical protein